MEVRTFGEAKSSSLASSLRSFLRSTEARHNQRRKQPSLPIEFGKSFQKSSNPLSGPTAFIDFLLAALPDHEAYLFGGAIRDFALFGRPGFNSDLDLVVTCPSSTLAEVLPSSGVARNKFGGFRLTVGQQEVDVWSAPETWAFKEGLLEYSGIESLLSTVVINWDAVLLNLRKFDLLTYDCFFEEIEKRHLDVRYTKNPNPTNVATKILRYISLKEVKTVSFDLVDYAKSAIKAIGIDAIIRREMEQFGSVYITKQIASAFLTYESDECSEIDIGDLLYVGSFR